MNQGKGREGTGQTPPRKQTSALKLTICLALAGFAIFGQSLNDPFHFDDVLILNDANVTHAGAWQHFLNPLHLRQLTFFSFYLSYLTGGESPAGYHVVNVALHIANAILLFALLTRLTERRFALIAAAVFLIHPIQTEPVMYVYQRSLLLACFFSLLALLAVERNRKWLALVLFLCAFESKESALAVPLLIPIWTGAVANLSSWWRSRSHSGHTAVSGMVEKFGFLIGVTALVGLLAVASLTILQNRGEKTVGFGAAPIVSPNSYFLTQTRVVYTYLRLLVFPVRQSLEYDFPPASRFGVHEIVQIAGLAMMLAAGLLLMANRNWRITGFAIIAFFVLLAPTSSIIPSKDAAFEHRLYLPMLGFSVFIASLISRLRHPAYVAAPLMVILSIVTIQRGTVWGSNASLWEDTVRHVPDKARAWFNLGGAYLRSDPDRATAAYQRVLQLDSDFAEAYYNLGVIEQTKGGYTKAIDYYQKTIAMNPRYWPVWNNLGNTLVAIGEKEKAIKAFETTLSLNPDHWPSQYNIAIVHFNSGRFEDAIPRLRTVLSWRPEFQDARYLLAEAMTRSGHREEAEREWKKLGRNPGQPPMPVTIPGPTR